VIWIYGPWWLRVQITTVRPSGPGRRMAAYKVCRYEKVEDYLDPSKQGKVIVSRRTWDQAVEWRDHYRKNCPENYYNITHATAVAVVEIEIDLKDEAEVDLKEEEGCKAP
jgi:hypothetical protein